MLYFFTRAGERSEERASRGSALSLSSLSPTPPPAPHGFKNERESAFWVTRNRSLSHRLSLKLSHRTPSEKKSNSLFRGEGRERAERARVLERRRPPLDTSPRLSSPHLSQPLSSRQRAGPGGQPGRKHTLSLSSLARSSHPPPLSARRHHTHTHARAPPPTLNAPYRGRKTHKKKCGESPSKHVKSGRRRFPRQPAAHKRARDPRSVHSVLKVEQVAQAAPQQAPVVAGAALGRRGRGVGGGRAGSRQPAGAPLGALRARRPAARG